MRQQPPAPHDTAAEEALLGAMLLSKQAIETAASELAPEDFYAPKHQLIFDAITRLWIDGLPADVVSVAALLKQEGNAEAAGGQGLLLSLQVGTPSTSSAGWYTSIILDHANRRRIIKLGLELAEQARQMGDPEKILDFGRTELAGMHTPSVAAPDSGSLTTVDEFLQQAATAPAPWVVPGLLRAGSRCIIIAPEGVGKSYVSRQMAICSAQGIHPFFHTPIPPVRSLIVDLENPDDAIAAGCQPITDKARADSAVYEEGRAWLWRQPGGINLRDRASRAALEAVIAACQPDLVCLGPIYKAYRSGTDSDEVAVGEVQAVFDDLRTRYNFSLLLEGHAPKGSSLSIREMLPHGSSMWMRWPELGIGMMPGVDDHAPAETSLTLGRFRGDRITVSWPDRLDRGAPGQWPWIGYWAQGYRP